MVVADMLMKFESRLKKRTCRRNLKPLVPDVDLYQMLIDGKQLCSKLRARAGAGSVIGPRSARLGHLVRERSGPNKDHAGPVLSSSRATKGADLVRANPFPDQIIKLSRARSNETHWTFIDFFSFSTLFLGALQRWQSESERAALRDAARLRKRVTIWSILVQSWPSLALNDHKE